MHYSSTPVASPAETDDTVYHFKLKGWAFVLVLQCLVMTMPTLKLLHLTSVSEWSWLLVTLPLWAPSVLLAVVLAAEQVAQLWKAKAGEQLHGLAVESSVVSY